MRQPILARTFACTAAVMIVAVALPALARKKRKPPALQLVVKEGKKALGTEVLRTRVTDTKLYFSTKTKMRQNGRSFVHRTHTILDPKHNFVTYDRWLDVKGATLRIRVFRFKDSFKKVEFSQDPKKKNKVDEIKIKAPVVVLDERSPTLLDLAIERFASHPELNWVRADSLQTGTMKLQVERLVDGKGGKWSRYLLTGKNLKAQVLRGPDGKAVHVDTGWGFSGTAKGKKVPRDLKPDPDAAAEAAQPTPEAAKDGKTPAPAKEPGESAPERTEKTDAKAEKPPAPASSPKPAKPKEP